MKCEAGWFVLFHRSGLPLLPCSSAYHRIYGLELWVRGVCYCCRWFAFTRWRVSHHKVDSGQTQSLSVTTVPAVFLVGPAQRYYSDWTRRNERLMSSIMGIIRPIAGWIDDQKLSHATRPVQPGVSLAMSAQELNRKDITLSSLFAICVHQRRVITMKKSNPISPNRLCDWFFHL